MKVAEGKLLSWITVVVLSASPLCAVPERFKADPASAKAGVAEYSVKRSSKTAFEVDVLDASNATIATLGVKLATAEGHVLNVEKGGNRLRVVVDLDRGKVTLTDLVTGESGSRTIDMARHAVVPEGSRRVFEENEYDLEFALMVFDQSLVNLGLGEYRLTSDGQSRGSSISRPATPSGAGPGAGVTPQHQYVPPGADGSGCSPDCNGPIVDGNHYTVASSRSLCCNAADQSTNEACSNKYCLGCCRMLGCDYVCGVGQYICGCSSEGQACSAPAFC
jgi:hypothetical protein